MDKMNEQLYQANIELVDKNKVLEEDKKILTKRINKAIEYIKSIEHEPDADMYIELGEYKEFKDILNILQGRYVEKGD